MVRTGEAAGSNPVWRKEAGLVSLGAWKTRAVNRDSAWQLHRARGCSGPVDRQFLILDPGFSALDG